MIEPNMATMLAYIFTDARVDVATLEQLLRDAVAVSFNMLSVDSDTSTSDTCAILANGLAGDVPLARLRDTLVGGCTRMTEILARDGEGAKHLLRATVRGAASDTDARVIAKSLVNSPLVKTMVAGADPNVGRLLMAVGKNAGCVIHPYSTDAWINGYAVVRGGVRVEFDDQTVRTALKNEVVDLEVALGVGDARATAYGCDLTQGYIDENAAYYSS
jgi:glutamate N-acetyltransferase/amino-acid N-acetyltransferase